MIENLTEREKHLIYDALIAARDRSAYWSFPAEEYRALLEKITGRKAPPWVGSL